MSHHLCTLTLYLSKIISTINSIKKKDPRIYDKTTKWFQENDDDASEEDEDDDEKITDSSDRNIRSGQKKVYKDVLREQLLNDGANVDEDEDTAGLGQHRRLAEGKKLNTLLYDKEQESLREDLLKAVHADSEDEDENEILRVRQKSPADNPDEDEALHKAIYEMQKLSEVSGSHEKAATSSSSSPLIPATREDAEKFLADYMLKKKWKDVDHYSADGVGLGDGEEIDYEAEEMELDRVDHFESKYNFRFEELMDGGDGAGQVVGHARQTVDSVRRADETRKKQREAKKERKEAERRQKEAELRRLKNLKREEVSIIDFLVDCMYVLFVCIIIRSVSDCVRLAKWVGWRRSLCQSLCWTKIGILRNMR